MPSRDIPIIAEIWDAGWGRDCGSDVGHRPGGLTAVAFPKRAEPLGDTPAMDRHQLPGEGVRHLPPLG